MPKATSSGSPQKQLDNKGGPENCIQSTNPGCTDMLETPLIKKSESCPSCCCKCGRKEGKESHLHTCCVCGKVICEGCVFKGFMYKRTSGWKCAGCVGTPSQKKKRGRF